jgi:energy-coupling factor transporter ATP-binding protein EcfA2
MVFMLTILSIFLITTLLTSSRSYSSGTSSRSLASKRVPRDAVVLFGPRSSGKTVLLHSLLGIDDLTTITSMAVTEKSSPPLPPLIDCPGHPRLLATTSLYLRRATTILFVVDSSAAKTLPAAASMLYKVLTSPHISGCSSIVIVCAKSDLPLSKSPLRVRSALTSTIDSLRVSASTTEVTGVLGDNLGTNDITSEVSFVPKFLGIPWQLQCIPDPFSPLPSPPPSPFFLLSQSVPLDVGSDRSFNFDKHSPVPVKFLKCTTKGGLEGGEGMRELMDYVKKSSSSS